MKTIVWFELQPVKLPFYTIRYKKLTIYMKVKYSEKVRKIIINIDFNLAVKSIHQYGKIYL